MPNLKENEMELVHLINFFSSRAEKLMKEGKLGQEHLEISKACDHLIAKLNAHASLREQVILRREELKMLIKENIFCPDCKESMLFDEMEIKTHEKGWELNSYNCRGCNKQFTWDTPNNPWDMVHYMLELVQITEERLKEETKEELRMKSELILAQTKKNLEKLRSIITACDTEFEKMQIRDVDMDAMIQEFKIYLLKEKIEVENLY